MPLSSIRSVLLVLLLWLAGLGAAMQFAKIAIPFSEFRILYPQVGSGIGWLLSIISLIGIFLGMTAGILAARIGFIKVLIFGMLLGAAMSFWQASFPSFGIMVISRLIEGISHLIIVVIAPTLIAQFSTAKRRGMAMTLWSTFFGVAFALTAWIGLPFVAGYGLDMLFIGHGLYMFIMAAFLLFAFRAFDIHVPTTGSQLNFKSIIHRHALAYRSPAISAPAVGWFFYTLTFVSLLAILPETIHADSRAFFVGIMPLVSIATALLLVSALLTWLSAVQVVIIGFAMGAAITFLTFTPLPMPYVWVCLFAILGLVQGGSFATVPELNVSAQDQALSNGVMAQAGNLGNTIGTPILLLSLNGFGTHGMLITVAVIYVLGAIGHIALTYQRQTRPRN